MSEATLRFRLALPKVCLFLTLFAIIPIAIFAQNNTGDDRITMNVKNASYREIFSEIKSQTGKVVWYDSKFDDTKKINVSFTNTPLNEVMNTVLKKTGLSWKTRNDNILINEKDIGSPVDADPKSVSNNQSGTGMPKSANNLIDINGTVTDEQNSPIPGATVLIKGTQTGTTTNSDGVFILKNVPNDVTIIISSVSYFSKEISVHNKKNIGRIELSKLTEQLDETVILAYTTTTGRKLTGNVSTVKFKAIQNSPVSNPILAVAGRVPGITITQASGFSGGGVDIVIQGLNSLQKGVSPFYVIDGVPYTQSLLRNLADVLKTSGLGDGDGAVNGSPLSFINPNDIESIEILKDADATAIYGSRAANGAIIITTKRGKSGKMKADIIYQKGFGKVAKMMPLMNTQEYLSMRREGKLNDGAQIRSTDYDINGTWDSTKNTDWQKELIGNKATYNDIQVSISGGNENIKYLIGSGYHKETTVFPTDLSNQKASVRFNLDATSNDNKFKVTFSGSYLNSDNNLPVQDITKLAMILAPNMPSLLNADGSLNWAQTSTGISTINPNPLAYLTQLYKNNTNNLIGNTVFSYHISKEISIKTNLGYNSLQTDELSTVSTSAAPPERRPMLTRTSTFGFNKISTWIIEPQISYNRDIMNGELSLLLGGSIQQSNKNRKEIMASGFSNDDLLENLSAATEITTPPNSTIISKYKYNAAFFQLNYNWGNKYIINISGRRDGSSRFGIKNRFHNFSAVGVAWIFSNESFIKRYFPVLSFGKLKSSFGTTGNDQVGDYSYLSLYESFNSDIPYRGGTSLEINRIYNPYLQWEQTQKFSIGLDIGFKNDRFFANTTFYKNRSSNMLVTASVPSTAGPIGGLIANLPAVIQNSGIEMSLSTLNIRTKNFKWSTDINLTVPKNKLKSFSNLESSPYKNIYILNSPVNISRVYKSAGVNATTGRYQFYDKEGKITETPSTDIANYNQTIDPNPKYYGGINNSFSLKGFSLDILFQYVKQKGKNAPYVGNPPGTGKNNQPTFVLNRWRKDGDIAPVQRYTSSKFDIATAFFNQLQSDYYWEDASFIRCKNVAFSYNFPTSWLSKARINSCRLFINAQNLFTITPYTGLDPETQSSFTMPPLRVITFGVNLTF